MALVHNIIIRGYNSMYLQATKLNPVDVPDFLRYCYAWYLFVIGHHDSEEKVLFPKIEEDTGIEGIMNEDIQEHGKFRIVQPLFFGQLKRRYKAAFHHGLDKMKAYVETCISSPSNYSGAELVKICDSFSAAFHSHLTSEPLKLLSLSKYDFDMKTLGDHTTQYALRRYSNTDVLPILWYNLDTKFEGGKWESFPQLPAPVKWTMVNILGWRRSNWWRFSSCGANLAERDELLCFRKDYQDRK
jgi:hypothetical protein